MESDAKVARICEKLCKVYEVSCYTVNWVMKGSLNVGYGERTPFPRPQPGKAALGIERAWGRRILDKRVCRATGRRFRERASQRLYAKRLTRCWYDQGSGTRRECKLVDDTVIKNQELLSDCTRRASRTRQREWEENGRRVGVECGKRDFTGAVC